MSKEICVTAPPWASPYIKLVCQSCGREFTRYEDDEGNAYTYTVRGEVPFPPEKECPACGNRGQNLWGGCRCCDQFSPIEGNIEHGDDAGYCAACCGNADKAGPFYDRGHTFEDDGEGRCEVCTEAERHGVHDPLDDEDEDDG
jgi:hypothetical protein